VCTREALQPQKRGTGIWADVWIVCPECFAAYQPVQPGQSQPPAHQAVTTGAPVPPPAQEEAPPEPPPTADPGLPVPVGITSTTAPETTGTSPAAPAIENGEPPVANLPATTSGGGAVATGGESSTHGLWEQAMGSIRQAASSVRNMLIGMLDNLHSADASRRQMNEITTWATTVDLAVQRCARTVETVNQMELPVLEAVGAAGGPDEVASMDYHSEA
jgi:hypothetical protein